jgi:transposase
MYLDGQRAKIIAWVAEGLSDRVIAERVRVSPSTVRYWRERNGVLRTTGSKVTRRPAQSPSDQPDAVSSAGELPANG